jgi:hypothetical protein
VNGLLSFLFRGQIKVDVGLLSTQLRKKAFKEQFHTDRINRCDFTILSAGRR